LSRFAYLDYFTEIIANKTGKIVSLKV
jgi:hypothetical protein